MPAPTTTRLSDADFSFVQDFLLERAGIKLSELKRAMVYGRLQRCARRTGSASVHDYLDLVRTGDTDESKALTNALTTNLTSFYRESHHFTALRDLIKDHETQRQRKLRIWSAACSTGQEPLSIAMTIMDEIGSARWNAKILATDIDSDILQKARDGCYPTDHILELPKRLHQYFRPDSAGENQVPRATLTELIRYRQLNLIESWPMRGPFDAIFCRNVLIYFPKHVQTMVVQRLVEYVRPGGLLFL